MDAFLGFDTLRRSDRQQWVSRWGRTVSGADHSAFWGEIGYYTYEADGSFSQWTDRPFTAVWRKAAAAFWRFPTVPAGASLSAAAERNTRPAIR